MRFSLGFQVVKLGVMVEIILVRHGRTPWHGGRKTPRLKPQQ